MPAANKATYYDWRKTLSYGADVTMVISARGAGKTYGLRKEAVKDFLRDGSRFVEIVRYKSQLKGEAAIQRGYFDKLVQKREFPGYIFKCEGTTAYIARDADKPKWAKLGYFVALSEMQQSKQRTFAQVKKVIFDEFIIDRRTRSRYLPGEYVLFVNLIDSLAREEVDENGEPMGTPVKAYLLGNACDLINPYFQHWRVNDKPRDGYSWIKRGEILLHYAVNETYAEGKRKTLVGRLTEGTAEADVIIGNEFNTGDKYNIAKKSPRAVFAYGLLWHGSEFGIWQDSAAGLVYVAQGVPKDSGRPVLSLTREDDGANVLMIRRGEKLLRALMEYYYNGLMRFASAGLREQFLTIMEMVGIK